MRLAMSETTTVPKKYLRREEAAHYVAATWGFPCSRQWLAKLATTGGGPAFYKAGRYPIYATCDLDAWAESRLSGPMRASGVPADKG